MSLEPGQMIEGKYRIVRKIGTGGIGSVYAAEHVAPVAEFDEDRWDALPPLAQQFLEAWTPWGSRFSPWA